MGDTTGGADTGGPGAADGALSIEVAEWESRAQRVRLSAERLIAVTRASGSVDRALAADAASGEYSRDLARVVGARHTLLGTVESWATESLAAAQRWGAAIEDYRRTDTFPTDLDPSPVVGADVAAAREPIVPGEAGDGE